MGIFGWSYPPGCSSTPYDEDHPCDVCGNYEDKCVCPECNECGDVGNPDCYKPERDGGHGMVMTSEQKECLRKNEEAWKKQAESEAAYCEEYLKEKEEYWDAIDKGV